SEYFGRTSSKYVFASPKNTSSVSAEAARAPAQNRNQVQRPVLRCVQNSAPVITTTATTGDSLNPAAMPAAIPASQIRRRTNSSVARVQKSTFTVSVLPRSSANTNGYCTASSAQKIAAW